jgi:hypothetical protein
MRLKHRFEQTTFQSQIETTPKTSFQALRPFQGVCDLFKAVAANVRPFQGRNT